jgi:hypothetical protein
MCDITDEKIYQPDHGLLTLSHRLLPSSSNITILKNILVLCTLRRAEIIMDNVSLLSHFVNYNNMRRHKIQI